MKKKRSFHGSRLCYLKIFRKMKLTVLVLLLSILGSWASQGYSQTTRLTLEAKNLNIEEFLRNIEDQSEYRFFYSGEIDVERTISGSFDKKLITEVLEVALKGTNIKYEVKGRQIILSPEGSSSYSVGQQQKSVSGKVTDSTGGSLPGVTVIIKGTTIGTITDSEGKYSFNDLPENALLIFSFVGMKSQEIPINGKNSINVTLIEETIGIEEVVAIGYGTARKRDLTGSVASVKGSDLALIPVSNVAQAIQGKMAGVTVTSVDGRPDAAIKIRVRGGGSITQSNDPLIIVDGFPVANINDIPVSQIESIDILKDASSTAIYGARGANGVVIVTTKSPKENKLTVTYDGYYQIKTLPKTIGVLDGSDYVMYNWELFNFGKYSASAYEKAFNLTNPRTADGAAGFKASIDAYNQVANTNWQKEIYGKPTYSQSHNVSVSGGTAKSKYSISFSNMDDDALKLDSWYKRNNIFAKFNQELAKGLIFNFDSRFTDSKVFGDGPDTNLAIRYAPVSPQGDISTTGNPSFNMNTDQVNPIYNPKALIQDSYNMNYNKKIQFNTSLSWDIIKSLTFRTEYGKVYGWNREYSFVGPLSSISDAGMPSASIARNESYSSRFVNTLSYDVNQFGDDHRLNFLIGQELNESDGENSLMKGRKYPKNFDWVKTFAMMDQWDKTLSISDMITNSMDVPSRMASFFARTNYVFKDRYLFTATFRADGSSKFAPENQWGYFPAAAFAWRINEENFMKNLTMVDNLKLRLSYGSAGNNRISDDLWRTTMNAASGGYPFGEIRQSYYRNASSMLVNPDLKWETTITRNIGIDFGLFNSRIYGTIDAYWNTTKNLLVESDIPAYIGYLTQQQNIGQTRNRGIEITIGGDIVRTKDFKLSANVNIAMNRTKIEKLAEGMPYKQFGSGAISVVNPSLDYQFEVGKETGLIRGYVTDGFYTTEDFTYDPATKKYTLLPGIPNSAIVYSLPEGMTPNGTTGAYPGALKFKKISDVDPDRITSSDITIIGNTNPKHVGGLNINSSYKNFDLLMAFNWSYGNDIYNANKLSASAMTQNTVNVNIYKEFATRYRIFDENGQRVYDPAGLNALNQNATIWYPYQNTPVVHSWGIEDGSYLRLNNLTLGYTLPKQLTKKAAISQFRLYATIYNAWIWTNYTGLDPEVDAAKNTSLSPGLDWNAYPRARTITFGVNLVF